MVIPNENGGIFVPTPNIYNNKYTPDPLPEIVAPRNALLSRLDQSAEKKLIFISAPAGSGKTVTAHLWMEKFRRKLVWIRLDAYDNNISIFYKMFGAAILSAQPGNVRMSEILQNPDFLSAPVDYTIMMLHEFAPCENGYILALDDYHTITNPEIKKSLPYILDRLPHCFVTLILGREEPDYYISGYSGKWQATIIGKDVLSFSADEIKEYSMIQGYDMTEEEAENTLMITNGLAVAVDVLSRSAALIPDRLRGLPFLLRGNRDFYDLTDKNIYIESVDADKRMIKDYLEQLVHSTSAGIYLEQNRTHDALTEARTANSALTDGTANEIRFTVYMHLAAIYLASGKQTELDVLIEEVEKFLIGGAASLRLSFLAFTYRVKLWDGEASAAKEWLGHYSGNETEKIEPCKLYQYFTTVRAYIVSGELEKAKDLAQRIRNMSKDSLRPQSAAEAGVLLAAVLWAEGGRGEAQEMMETVLFEMQRYSFIRLIADEGAAVIMMLKKILKKVEQESYHDILDPIYVKSVYIAAYVVSRQRNGITSGLKKKLVTLSKQQRMAIQFLARGFTRESIVAETGLSLNTVNTHIRIAYSKLGVSSAADAAVKARELGIIE